MAKPSDAAPVPDDAVPDAAAVPDASVSDGAVPDGAVVDGDTAPLPPGAVPGGDTGAGRGPQASTTSPSGGRESRAVPSQEELERFAVDVRVRRRPRYGVFVALGMLLTTVAAIAWAMSVPQEQHANWGATIWVTAIAGAAFGALLGAGVAVLADWWGGREK